MLLGILIVVCVAMLAIGLLVLAQNSHSQTNRSFFYFQLFVVGWIIANFFTSSLTLTTSEVVIVDRMVMALPAISLYFLMVFSLSLTEAYRHLSAATKVVPALVMVILAIICATPGIIQNVVREDGQNVVVFGMLTILYLIYVSGLFITIVASLLRGLKKAHGNDKIRLQYVLGSLFITVAAVVITNFLFPYIGRNFTLVPYGPLLTIVMIGGFAFAIIRHRLFNIRFIIARSLAYFMLLGTLGLLYGAAVFGISMIFLGISNHPLQLVVNTILAVLLAFTFQPLRHFFERITNQTFYRDHYDSQIVLNNFTQVLVSELDLNRILKHALTQLCESVKIQFAQIVVFNNDRVYRIEHYGPLPRRLMIAPELAKLDKAMLVADELEGGERKSILDKHSIRLSMMLRTREEFVGYLLLGDKLSGDIYSSQDVELLEIIGKELAVAILNAKAYAEIQEFNLTLQARIDHATNRLRVANRHLKELDHAKDEFISMASHQLRTPLTTIKGYLSMMLEGDAGKLNKAQTEFVDYAFGSSERMVNLISDLLNVSRLSAGRFLIQTKPTDMVQMISDEVRQLSTHATAKGIKLIFDHPADPLPPAEIDDNKTRQVIMNFIDNAIYYTQKGEVRVTLEQSGDKVRLEVRDTGIGVPDKAKRKLFSKFFRADNAQIVRPDGTGLGLYLAKRVVEDQGGTIIFNSVEGKGSTFGFELPFKPHTPNHEDNHAKHQ